VTDKGQKHLRSLCGHWAVFA